MNRPTQHKCILLLAVWITAPLFLSAVSADVASQPTSQPPVTTQPKPDPAGVDHKIWDYLLKKYVKNGSVDYRGIKLNPLFKTYLDQLADARLEKLTDKNDRLALLCNAYNALVINGVIAHNITRTIADFKLKGVKFFDLKEHVLAGKTVSLNDIEHKMIRPKHAEPRIHMALVCAAKSCPAIRPEAYLGSRIEKQLEKQARLFANNKNHVRYDPGKNKLHLNPILKWYARDFDAGGGYLKFLTQRVKDIDLKKALQKAATGKVKVIFNKYDWSLNKPNNKKAGPKSI